MRVPDEVREKLLASGASLDAQEWGLLPAVARDRLVEWAVDQRIDREAYSGFVTWLRDTFLSKSGP